MSDIQVNDVNFYFELRGKGEPLVLIAGYSCDHTFWSGMIDFLAQHFQVLVFDNRGMGQTSAPPLSLTIDMMADDTVSLIKALDLKRPFILGQSMGGAIAQIIARKHPEYIRKLIVLNSCAKINTRTLFALESFYHLLKENAPLEQVIEASMPWFFSSDYLADPKNIITYKELLKSNPFPPTLENLHRQFIALQQFDSRTWLQEIQTPTLVIAAQEDICCLVQESEEFAYHLPNAQLAYLAGGHSSPIENPSKVNEIITNFIL